MHSLHRPSPGVLEIREGGGCISVFGLPFLASGLFLLAALAGLVPLGGTERLPWWGWLVLTGMGMAFTGVGLFLVFGRRRISLETATGMLTIASGVPLIHWREQTHPLGNFDAVHLTFREGDSDTAATFPVVLHGRSGQRDVQVVSLTSYSHGRDVAVEIARLLHRALVDCSTPHRTELTAHELDLPLRDRRRGAPISIPSRPAVMRSEVQHDSEGTHIDIPPARLHYGRTALAFMPLAIALGVMLYLRAFFDRTSTPVWVQVAFLGFVAVAFGLLPFALAMRKLLTRLLGRTRATVSADGITLEEKGIWRTQVRAFRVDDIMDIDYDAPVPRMQRGAAASSELGPSTIQIQPGHTGHDVPRWAAALAPRFTSRGVLIKTRREIVEFAAGVHPDEARHLAAVMTARLCAMR